MTRQSIESIILQQTLKEFFGDTVEIIPAPPKQKRARLYYGIKGEYIEMNESFLDTFVSCLEHLNTESQNS